MKFKNEVATVVARDLYAQLKGHCLDLTVVGSLRRREADVKDIDFLINAKPFDIGLLECGITTVIDKLEFVRGKLGKKCKQAQRIHESGINIDFFFANKTNWGYLTALKTGSKEFNQRVLVRRWKQLGYEGRGGYLTKDGVIIPVLDEVSLFKILDLDYIAPWDRH
jgi:DNA polymerase/3'-5' exonuclease PolX